jgi:hypothetical protein
MFKLLIIITLLSSFGYANSDLHREIESDLYAAEPIYTGAQGLDLVNKLLKQNFKISDSKAKRINIQNSPRLIKMREYDQQLAKYKYVVLTEALKKNPNHKKLDLLYEQINELRANKKKMWIAMKKSIWSIMDVEYPSRSKAEREQDTMGSLRW